MRLSEEFLGADIIVMRTAQCNIAGARNRKDAAEPAVAAAFRTENLPASTFLNGQKSRSNRGNPGVSALDPLYRRWVILTHLGATPNLYGAPRFSPMGYSRTTSS